MNSRMDGWFWNWNLLLLARYSSETNLQYQQAIPLIDPWLVTVQQAWAYFLLQRPFGTLSNFLIGWATSSWPYLSYTPTFTRRKVNSFFVTRLKAPYFIFPWKRMPLLLSKGDLHVLLINVPIITGQTKSYITSGLNTS